MSAIFSFVVLVDMHEHTETFEAENLIARSIATALVNAGKHGNVIVTLKSVTENQSTIAFVADTSPAREVVSAGTSPHPGERSEMPNHAPIHKFISSAT